jgi:hypothetical protein
MNKKTKEVAKILDENMHKKKPEILSESLSEEQIVHIKEFIKSFNNVEKFLRYPQRKILSFKILGIIQF